MTESLGTFAVVSLVFACVFRITGVPVYLAFLFGGIVLATAPAPSLSIVNELKTNGPVTRTLMPMAALDDLVGATVFFVVVALVSAQISSVGIPVAGILVLVFLPGSAGRSDGLLGRVPDVPRADPRAQVFGTMLVLLAATAGLGALVNALLPVPVLNFMLLGMSFSAAFANAFPKAFWKTSCV